RKETWHQEIRGQAAGRGRQPRGAETQAPENHQSDDQNSDNCRTPSPRLLPPASRTRFGRLFAYGPGSTQGICIYPSGGRRTEKPVKLTRDGPASRSLWAGTPVLRRIYSNRADSHDTAG